VREIVAGYKVQKLEDGTTELVEPGPAWGVACFGLLWAGVGIWGLLTPSGWQAGVGTPFLLLLVSVVPGTAMVLPCLRWLIFERRWLIRQGEIAARPRILGIGVVRGGRFQVVRSVQVRHGIWRLGQGCTDVFRLYLDGARGATEFASGETGGGGQVDSDVLALGQLIAFRVGRKLEVVTETIWKWPSGGD
jgi:hypothetical protein